jgi:HSP20 family molecular chaperone IbpA
VDIYEDEHTITLKLEVPRIDEKEIDVRIENNTFAGSITAGSITKGHDTVNVA